VASDLGADPARAEPSAWPRGAPLRLGAALALSVALHLSIIYGVTVVAPGAAGEAAVIHARVTPAEPDPSVPAIVSPRGHRLQGLRPVKRPPARAEHEEAEPVAAVEAPAAAAPATALPKVEMPLLADPTWYPAKQLDVYPQLLAPARPRYPEAAARDNLTGAVTLLLMVDETGLVRDADVAQADPPGYFEEEALAAFRDARFTPAARDGRPVRSRILVRVTFSPGTSAQPRE
jgi:protein TonB